MLKKIGIAVIILSIFICLTACGSNVKLFNTKDVVRIGISDGQTLIIVENEDKINEFVDKFYKYNIESDILEVQENGNKKIGEAVLSIEVRGRNDKVYVFDFTKYKPDENSPTHYYFQKYVRGFYYLSHELSSEDENYITTLFYGDIIIID